MASNNIGKDHFLFFISSFPWELKRNQYVHIKSGWCPNHLCYFPVWIGRRLDKFLHNSQPFQRNERLPWMISPFLSGYLPLFSYQILPADSLTQQGNALRRRLFFCNPPASKPFCHWQNWNLRRKIRRPLKQWCLFLDQEFYHFRNESESFTAIPVAFHLTLE